MAAALGGMRKDDVEVGSLNFDMCAMDDLVLAWRCELGLI